MKFDEIVKSNIGLDFTSNNFTLELVKVNVTKQSFSIHLVFDKALTYEEYEVFCQGVKKYFSSIGYKADCNISYKNEELSENDWISYLKSILIDLNKGNFLYNALASSMITYNGKLWIHLESDAAKCDDLLEAINDEFAIRGFEMSCGIIYDVEKKLDDIIEESHAYEQLKIDKKVEIANEIKQKTENIAEINKNISKEKIDSDITPIKVIPTTQAGLMQYLTEEGLLHFKIEGEIIGKSLKETPKSKRMSLKIYDGETSIVVQKWCGRANEMELYNTLNKGDVVEVSGDAVYSQYERMVIVEAKVINYIGKVVKEEVMDTALTKRVELHCHTKMTTLDGLTEASDYVKMAKKWGHKAIAITDLDGLLAVPELAHSIKGDEIKPIVGTELNFINDEKYFITMDAKDMALMDATYVVFDIETTGLSQSYDEIIEIAAHKVYKNGIIDVFETFVKPKMKISAKITELTSITDEMVKDAPSIEEILPKFLEFCKDCVLVAHNASFDIGMMYEAMRKQNLYNKDELFPVIDTLNGLRVLHYEDLKKFNLPAMCKFYKVKQEHHHRATDDTRVTAECFILMLQEFIKAGCKSLIDINNLIPDTHYQMLFPTHITLLAKNQNGYKNLYKIVSDALTVHCNKEGVLLKSVLDKYREDILVGSACHNGAVFEAALNGSYQELKEAIAYCDYIEVQPPMAYGHLIEDLHNGIEDIKDVINRIIKEARLQKKIVVATSNCHYARPELKPYRDILIASPQIGGGKSKLSRYKNAPDAHFRTTNEMLDEFNFLDPILANEIVVENTNKIADMIEFIQFFPKKMFVPADDEFKDSLGVASIVESMKEIVWDTCKKMYGEKPHPYVTERIEHELNCIIGAGYSSVYYMSYLLVKKSVDEGYLVGSRGSVGSSLAATMMNITEINPLLPHYRCKHCHFQAFKMNNEMIAKYGITPDEEKLQPLLQKVESGYDLDDALCPVCGKPLTKDGQDIPFETFLGFKGDKVPDIDLNFSGEYQPTAHEYVRELMGSEHAFRGGTTGTIAEKNAYGYVKGYCEDKNIDMSPCLL